MRQLTFTVLAERQLDDILSWKFEEFGPQQAERYEDELINRCAAIASGVAATQNCSMIMQPGAVSALRFGRAGQHLVVFLEKPDAIIIVGFLHGKSDLAAQLELLSRKLER
ncbi:MAG: type II toxin-antitoxin system RelE/ParE family toxin [Sulfitobacter sp.]